MRPRYYLLLFGFLVAVLSFLALAKNSSISPSILGATISEKIELVPSSPTLYFVVFLIIGVLAIIFAFLERKIVY